MSMIRRLSNPEVRIQALVGRLQQYPSSAAFFPLASHLWEKGEAIQAENLLESGLATYPNYAAAGVLLGEILISKGDHEQAARFIAKALEITPWNISGQYLLAKCFRKEGNEDAAKVAQSVVNMLEADEVRPQIAVADPDADCALVDDHEDELGEVVTPALAELYLAQGFLDKAQDVYERLLESDPAKVEWNERLAAIRKQLSQHEDVDAPTGYSGTEDNLDLIAGEVKGESKIPDEAKSGAVTPDEIEHDEGGADTSSAESQESAEDLSPTGIASEVNVEGPEFSVSPEVDVVSEEVVDPILHKMIELYIQEGNDSQALDLCRKAQFLGENTPWILGKISALVQNVEESTASLLCNKAEEDKDPSTPLLPLSDKKVVETLEGWLKTLHRRIANV